MLAVQGVMPMVGQGAPLRPPFAPARPPPQQWVPTNPQQDQGGNKMVAIQRPGMMMGQQQQMMQQPVINPSEFKFNYYFMYSFFNLNAHFFNFWEDDVVNKHKKWLNVRSIENNNNSMLMPMGI